MGKVKFEVALKDLEGIVERLESGDLSLDESLLEYENGIKLYRQCMALLEDAEKKVRILIKNGNGGFSTRELESES